MMLKKMICGLLFVCHHFCLKSLLIFWTGNWLQVELEYFGTKFLIQGLNYNLITYFNFKYCAYLVMRMND